MPVFKLVDDDPATEVVSIDMKYQNWERGGFVHLSYVDKGTRQDAFLP
jgi:hypothetical protein